MNSKTKRIALPLRLLADNRTRLILKVGGTVLALLGLAIGGVASDPPSWPG